MPYVNDLARTPPHPPKVNVGREATAVFLQRWAFILHGATALRLCHYHNIDIGGHGGARILLFIWAFFSHTPDSYFTREGLIASRLPRGSLFSV